MIKSPFPTALITACNSTHTQLQLGPHVVHQQHRNVDSIPSVDKGICQQFCQPFGLLEIQMLLGRDPHIHWYKRWFKSILAFASCLHKKRCRHGLFWRLTTFSSRADNGGYCSQCPGELWSTISTTMTPKCLQRRFGCWNTSGPRKEASQLHNTARTSKYYRLQYTSLQLRTMSNCSHNDSTLKWQVDQQKTFDHCGTITARSAILISKVYLNIGQFPEVLVRTGYKRFSNSEYGCTNVLSVIETHIIINDQKYKFSKCYWGILKSVYHVCAHKVSAVQNVGQSLLEDLKMVALTLKAATVTAPHFIHFKCQSSLKLANNVTDKTEYSNSKCAFMDRSPLFYLSSWDFERSAPWVLAWRGGSASPWPSITLTSTCTADHSQHD